MDLAVLLLADIAMPSGLAGLNFFLFKKKVVWSGRDGLAAQLADAGLHQYFFFAAGQRLLAPRPLGLRALASRGAVRLEEARDRLVQALAILRRQPLQQRPVRAERFKRGC